MEFEFKLYDWTGKFKSQLNPKQEYSKIQFQEELDGGQGNLSLTIQGNLEDFQNSDIIEIRNSETGNLYTGILEYIDIKEFQDSSILSLNFLGSFTILNDIIYKVGGLREFTATGTPGEIIKNIIDSFNSDYGALYGDTKILQNNIIRYTGDSVDISGDGISIDFDNVDCITAIKSVLEDTGFNFYIGVDGIIYVTLVENQDKKYITFEREILSISRSLDKKDLTNKYYLARSGGTYKTYEDIVSQTEYGLKEKSNVNTDIDEATQDIKGSEFIERYKNDDNVISIKIKANSIELKPGDLITTLNSRNNLIEKQITKIDIKKEFWEIYLGDFLSFGKTITKNNFQ